jgi:hypothetical protein
MEKADELSAEKLLDNPHDIIILSALRVEPLELTEEIERLRPALRGVAILGRGFLEERFSAAGFRGWWLLGRKLGSRRCGLSTAERRPVRRSSNDQGKEQGKDPDDGDRS